MAISKKQLRILYVEDSEIMGRSVERNLRKKGYDFEWCREVDSAMAHLEDLSFNVLITDRQFEEEDLGDYLIRMFREQNPKMHIIATSAYYDIPKGANGCLPKCYLGYIDKLIQTLETLEVTL